MFTKLAILLSFLTILLASPYVHSQSGAPIFLCGDSNPIVFPAEATSDEEIEFQYLPSPDNDLFCITCNTPLEVEKVTLTNSANPDSGSADDFTITDDPCNHTVITDNCSINVGFSPTARRAYRSFLTLTPSWRLLCSGWPPHARFKDASVIVELQGQGLRPVVSLSTTQIQFDHQPIDKASSAHTVTVTNTGDDDLAVSSVTANSDFIIDSETCTEAAVAPNGTCSIGVIFIPLSAGNFDGMVLIEDNTTDSSQSITLEGVGTADPTPSVSISKHLNHGDHDLNSASSAMSLKLSGSQEMSATMTNSGDTALEIASISSDNTDFAVSDDCPKSPATVAVDGTCTITSTFTPSDTGSITGNIDIVSDSNNAPSIFLTGMGIDPNGEPVASLSTTEVDFGVQRVDTSSSSQTISVTNTGTSPLEISSVDFGGDAPQIFPSSEDCSNSTVAIGGTCTINVTFTPNVLGQLNATIVITDDASDSTQTITLTGHGVSNTGGCQLLR